MVTRYLDSAVTRWFTLEVTVDCSDWSHRGPGVHPGVSVVGTNKTVTPHDGTGGRHRSGAHSVGGVLCRLQSRNDARGRFVFIDCVVSQLEYVETNQNPMMLTPGVLVEEDENRVTVMDVNDVLANTYALNAEMQAYIWTFY